MGTKKEIHMELIINDIQKTIELIEETKSIDFKYILSEYSVIKIISVLEYYSKNFLKNKPINWNEIKKKLNSEEYLILQHFKICRDCLVHNAGFLDKDFKKKSFKFNNIKIPMEEDTPITFGIEGIKEGFEILKKIIN